MISLKLMIKKISNNPVYFYYFIVLLFANLVLWYWSALDGNGLNLNEKTLLILLGILSYLGFVEALDEKSAKIK